MASKRLKKKHGQIVESKPLSKKKQRTLITKYKKDEKNKLYNKDFVEQFNADTIISKHEEAQAKHIKDTAYVVDKDGKINQKVLSYMMQSTKDDAMRDFMEGIARNNAKNKVALTIRSLTTKIQKETLSKARRLLANAGWSIQEFEQEYGISESDIDNPDNWLNINGDDFLVVNGHVFIINKEYESQLIEEITNPRFIEQLGLGGYV